MKKNIKKGGNNKYKKKGGNNKYKQVGYIVFGLILIYIIYSYFISGRTDEEMVNESDNVPDILSRTSSINSNFDNFSTSRTSSVNSNFNDFSSSLLNDMEFPSVPTTTKQNFSPDLLPGNRNIWGI